MKTVQPCDTESVQANDCWQAFACTDSVSYGEPKQRRKSEGFSS